ncbi:PREDICTED: 16 kDa beta-galactoside-binding lectin-like [Gekko japonicus]|uniref:Galectin n=1 Tax=Gekko japonicus TaxID=146911 RepID=A0ABM1K1F4_GEKJA|nr:PREDICTED: 16 kDa beta-galactoside-binding lectin-like [Gekko japonicus]
MDRGLTATQLKLQSGESFQVKGKVLPDAKGFTVNVGKDSENLVLHFNPRFDLHGDVDTIVLNSRHDGAWGEEQRESHFPFQPGEKAEVTIVFDASEVKVKLADGHEISFPNRLGLETIHFLSVEGDFKIKALKF